MNKLSILAVAAAVGALGFAGTDVALAKKKKRSAGQKFSCVTSKGKFKDNVASRAKDDNGQIVPMGLFSFGGLDQLVILGTQQNIGRTGAGSIKIMNLIVLGVDDVRSATLPITYEAGGAGSTVTGSFSLNSFKFSRFKIPGLPGGGGSVKTTSNSWVPDEKGQVPYSVTLTKYDSVTNRLSGKFGGEMLPGDSNTILKNLKVKKGAFTVECRFN